MKVLVFSMSKHGFQEACQYEAALEFSKKGADVMFLYCDGALKLCGENRRCDKYRCAYCSLNFKRRVNKYLNDNIRKVALSECLTDDIMQTAKSKHFKYDSSEDLKKLFFHGVDIGYGALSSYVTWTRNLNPDFFRPKVREYFDLLLQVEVKLVLVAEKLIADFDPNLVIFHNGRFNYYKPFYRISQINHIPFICTETAYDLNQNVYREFIDNDIPHSVSFRTKIMNDYWNNAKDKDERDKLTHRFFENRRHAKYSGDKAIYTLGQQEGALPLGFDKNVENIAIFNSSEDEQGVIGDEFDKLSLFKSQYDGIVSIMERFKDDNTKHFYLRIHPNLKNVPYDYHINLHKLNYPNLTVIPGDSPVSSYALMEVADKVIVFGSSMGAESAYWGKTVICLSFARYLHLGCVYTPKTKDEVWELIDTKELPALDSKAAMKFGYSIITPEKEKFHYLDMSKSVFLFRGRKRRYPAVFKLFGSTKLAYIADLVWTELYRKLKFCGRYPQIPV